MLICIFSIFFLVGFSRGSLINVNFDENQSWQTTIFNSEFITFKVTQQKSIYCYVNITLEYKDPNFLIMADYKQLPKTNLILKYKQGEKIDRISQLENRKTRFLKLKGNSADIYITVMADYLENKYNISIIRSNDEICENQCFLQNGICKSDGCHCLNSFIGNDCSQQSQELIFGNEYDINSEFNTSIRFFSINLQPLIRQTLQLYFQTDCKNCLAIIIYKTKALLQTDFDKNQDYVKMYQIEDQQATILTEVPQTLPASQNILNFAVIIKYSDNQKTNLKIGFNQQISQDDDTQTEMKLYIIIPSIGGGIIFIGVLFFCLCKYIKKQNPDINQVVAQDPNVNNNQIQINQNNIHLDYQEKSDNCAICLDSLEEPNLKVVKIKCCHQFHQQCIQNWSEKRNSCPLCQKLFDKSEIF
ncbi:unnamed protein product [Paramecium sonneborni]|uniref:RING-type domain-containing protein n=1 Tax=Paramecium sonneborni TaxID=65129 RepID=A0A8S1QYN2_9CILI|nr:unnamed protein product [Paramecium sonneborni]